MMHFVWPWAFALLPLPWLLRLLLPRATNNNAAALQVAYIQDFQINASSVVSGTNAKRWPLLIYILLWVCLLSATARPQWIGDAIELPASGRDLMMAIDLSGSMAEPFNRNFRNVNKLDATKAVASNFIEKRVGDRVGLILFGDQAYLQSPLTFDRTTVRILLAESVVNLAGRATAIGDAIGLAIKRFSDHKDDDRVLILLTDGMNTAGEIKPDKAAELAAKKGLKIYTIGIGDRGSRDLDEQTLNAIAEATGGRYFRAHNIEELQQIYQLLDELEPSEKESQTYRPTWSLFYWPLSIALVFAAILALAKWRGLA
ncbi:MAG: VWA domain-containing protein [Gammaproteobacteria bacterium]|nr:VWA domain-containing protein [Gammaproteobacteria bacterium]